jgi:hypothetical protein
VTSVLMLVHCVIRLSGIRKVWYCISAYQEGRALILVMCVVSHSVKGKTLQCIYGYIVVNALMPVQFVKRNSRNRAN